MATRYVTLKDSNGDTLYPQISTDSITNNSITSDKIDWTTVSPTDYSTSDALTASSGYTVSGRVYKLGKLVFGNLVVNKTSGYFGAQAVVATFKSGFVPKYDSNSYCALSNNIWGSNSMGYMFIGGSTGVIYIGDGNSTTTNNYAKLSFTFITS